MADKTASPLDTLKRPSDTNIPLFDKIFAQCPIEVRHHYTAPLLEERLMYLQYCSDNGWHLPTIQMFARYLLIVMRWLDFYQLRTVTAGEIEKAADNWARAIKNPTRTKGEYSKPKKAQFMRSASSWLGMLGCLKQRVPKPIPFETYLNQFVDYMRQEQGLAEITIQRRSRWLRDFLINVHAKKKTFIELTPSVIDEVLINKYNTNHYSRVTVKYYASIVRPFLRYAGSQGWCQKNLAGSIKTPRIYQYESLPDSPSRNDVKKLVENSVGDTPIAIRDHAVLMLLSAYGIRASEVAHLRLEDIDWRKELIYLRRAKRSKPQIFPLSKNVGEAILRYLIEVRPRHCTLREVFLCANGPYRPLNDTVIHRIISTGLKSLGLKMAHYGARTLRHACATHLINKGTSLKEISDYLGHRKLDTTRIYAKVDLTNLRKVAEFDLRDVL